MGGYEIWTQPATDVPARHCLNGLINTAVFRNRSAVAAAYVYLDFDSGERIQLFAGEQFVIEAMDTSSQQDTGKLWGRGFYATGDAANAQVINLTYTTKAPLGDREPVTV
jgi:hypothetical protein